METPQGCGARVAWAIEQSGFKLEALADRIGCTHATLSQWKSESTDLGNAKTRLVYAFCEATGVALPWLIHGQGPARTVYSEGSPALVVKARELLDNRPELVNAAERMLDALRDTPTSGA